MLKEKIDEDGGGDLVEQLTIGERNMRLNTIVKLPDGRIGTICHNHLDGNGGVWGRHYFEMPEGGFGDLPEPDFMLRGKQVEQLLRENGHRKDMECVGGKYEILW